MPRLISDKNCLDYSSRRKNFYRTLKNGTQLFMHFVYQERYDVGFAKKGKLLPEIRREIIAGTLLDLIAAVLLNHI